MAEEKLASLGDILAAVLKGTMPEELADRYITLFEAGKFSKQELEKFSFSQGKNSDDDTTEMKSQIIEWLTGARASFIYIDRRDSLNSFLKKKEAEARQDTGDTPIPRP